MAGSFFLSFLGGEYTAQSLDKLGGGDPFNHHIGPKRLTYVAGKSKPIVQNLLGSHNLRPARFDVLQHL